MILIQKELDTRGLNCPLPILKAKKALADMASGQVLKVLATDPGSVRDFQAFAKQTGNELVEQATLGSDFVHVLLTPTKAAQLRDYVRALDEGRQDGDRSN